MSLMCCLARLIFDIESSYLMSISETSYHNGMKRVKETGQYEAFEGLLKQVIQVPHSEIKAKLDAEKQHKKEKRPKTSDASRASGDTH